MTTEAPIDQAELQRFADAVISIAHRIEPRTLALPDSPRLTPRDIEVLHEIAVRPASTATEIARGLGLQRSNVSATLHALRRAGLVTPGERTGGGRGVGFVLTTRAESDVARVRAHRADRLGTVPAEVLRRALSATQALVDVSGQVDLPE
ncbi:MarR family transcriptional regulator [Zhihengliuella sp. ISTPL4]|uniref:MarR family transcriptional regulator n=1 Tax=Zhihengliuella sp. ISTPL4 TaxID=2058657 RepID=UPI000C7A8760|nr:helix-turn-helix domain-containing protein [Zhihengliuella sp. ISTPL4]